MTYGRIISCGSKFGQSPRFAQTGLDAGALAGAEVCGAVQLGDDD